MPISICSRIEKIPWGEESPFGGETRVVVKYEDGEEVTYYCKPSNDDNKLADWIEKEKPLKKVYKTHPGLPYSPQVDAEISCGDETVRQTWYRNASKDEITFGLG